MNKFYPNDAGCVNPVIFGIPLEVAQDRDLSDSAVLLFGEVYGLIRAYGICNAHDSHFQERRRKSRSTIQALFGELRKRGYVYIISDKHTRREIRIPQRFLGGKDGDQNFPENWKDANEGRSENWKDSTHCPENRTDGANFPGNRIGGCPENETHKTPEFEEEKESKNTDSESYKSRGFCNSISNEDRQKAQETWELFQSHKANGSVKEYESLLLRCRGRQECFEIGVLSARISKDAKTLRSPIALIRSVMENHRESDKDAALALLDEMAREYETPEQRREIDTRERRLATEKAANQAPPQAEVEALLQGAAKSMPVGVEVQTRINALTAFDQGQIKHIANKLAQEANPKVALRLYADRERQALVQSVTPRAFDEWEVQQAAKPKPQTRQEMAVERRDRKESQQ